MMDMGKLMIIPLSLTVMYTLMNTHVMKNLIVMEYLVLVVVTELFVMLTTLNFENYLAFYFIVMMITESVVGLSLMINMIRTHGNDFLKSSSVVKF